MADQLHIDEVSVVGAQGQVLEGKEALRVGHHHQHILNSDSVFSRLVVAGLIRHDHIGLEDDLVVFADSDWAFVHSFEVADPVARAVGEVESLRPKVSPGEHVELSPSNLDILGPLHPFDVEVSEEHPCVGVSFFGGGLSEVEGPGHIGCAVQVLSSRVHQVDHILGDLRAHILSRMVVDDSRIRTAPADGRKTQPFVVLLLVAEVIQVEGGFIFSHHFLLGPPSPELGHCNSIGQVASPEAVNFLLGPDSPEQSDALPFDRLLNGGKYVVVQLGHPAQDFPRESWVVGLNCKVDPLQVFEDFFAVH